MATWNLTINGPSSSPSSNPDPLPTGGGTTSKGDTVNFLAGTTGYPSIVYFKSSSIFGSKAISVGTSPQIKSNASSGNYKFYNEEQLSEDEGTSNGAQVGTIKVG